MYLVLIYAYHLGLFGMQYEKLSNLYQTKSHWNIYEGWHVSFITNKMNANIKENIWGTQYGKNKQMNS